MGEVYRADDTGLKRPVALKRIAPAIRDDERSRKRLWHEAECASRLNDPHIAAIFDVLEEGDDLFLVMEYVEGQTLRQHLQHRPSVAEFLKIAEQCASALAAAHKQGVLHSDIKPENIMLTPTSEIKILDFGVAHALPQTEDGTTKETQTSAGFAGTLAYTAPETLQKEAPDARADIFSLGVVFYESLAGKHPFRAEGFLETCERILHQDPVPLRQLNPQVPEELERLVTKMLAKDPAERHAAAAEILAELRTLERLFAVPGEPVVFFKRRRRVAVTASLLSVTTLLVLVAMPTARQHIRAWLGFRQVPQEKELAVLPFTVVSPDPETAAFSAGLSETLTAKLTQLTAAHTLQVVSATELQARHVTTVDQARKEFGVTVALEGSLHRSGTQVRINYALVDAHTHRQLRADTLTLATSDPFSVQDQIVNGAVAMLELELKPHEREVLEAHGTQVAGAYELYLQGRGYLQNFDREENLDRAIRVFEQALASDPNYALAYAGLGDAYWKKYVGSKETHWVEKSREACERASSLDTKLAAANVCLGTLESGTGETEKAVAQFEEAVEAEPTNDEAYRGLADAYERLGKVAEAEKTFRRAIDLRPHYWAGYNRLGALYYQQARYQDAAAMFNQVIALVPDSFVGYSNLGAAYVEQGRYAEAISDLERSIAIRPMDYAYTNLGNAYFFLRQYDQAAGAYEQAVKLTAKDPLLWWNLGDGYYWTPGKRVQSAAAYRQAIALAEEGLRVNQRDAYALGILAICHAMLDERRPALQYLEQGLKYAPKDPEMRFKAALVYNHFGEIESALTWLNKGLAAGYSPSRIRDTPDFDPLRANPRFQELLGAK